MRNLVRAGSAAVALLAIMVLGSVVLWVGLPLAWLWIGSQIQGSTQSLGAAVGAMLVGFVVSVAAVMPVLFWLSNRRRELQVARGEEDTGHFALEVVLVSSATLAALGFGVWFFGFSGANPLPFYGGNP